MDKSEIRQKMKKERALMPKADAVQKSIRASHNFTESSIYESSKCVMLYSPIGNETDTSMITRTLLADGKQVVFPVTDEKTGIITPYYAGGDTVFKTGAFHIEEPVGTVKADLDDIDVIIVPGVAFDMKGARIGFGKGCYDRLLAKCKAVKVGYCYEFQLCDDIPADEYDVGMDYIVTENGVYEVQD